MMKRTNTITKTQGFTLLEMLVATAIFAVLAGALYSAFSGAIGLRERAYETIEREMPATASLEVLRRDLAGMVIPNGVLAGAMLGAAESAGGSNSDTLQFCTSSGSVRENAAEPWGDIQRVTYRLEAGASDGQELTRYVSRNLLAPAEDDPAPQRLLAGIESLRFRYYAGSAWYDAWDSTLNDNTSPQAVRVRIEFEPRGEGETARVPIDFTCEMAAQLRATTDTTTTMPFDPDEDPS